MWRRGTPSGAARPSGPRFDGEVPGPEQGDAEHDQLRDEPFTSPRGADNGRLDGGEIFRPDDVSVDEMEPRRPEPRAGDGLCHEDQRHGEEKAGIGGEVEQKGLSWRRPKRPALDQGEYEERNPGDQQEPDTAPPDGRPRTLDESARCMSRYAGPPSSNFNSASCASAVVMLSPASLTF